MPIDSPPQKWPFHPNSLENAIEGRVLQRLLAGASSVLDAVVVAIPRSKLDGTQNSSLTRPGRDPFLGTCDFCRLLRSKEMLGFDFCKKPDLAHISNIWNNYFLNNDLAFKTYICDFGLTNWVFPLIAVNNLVGCLIVGQRLASEENRSLGLAKIKSLQIGEAKRKKLSEALRSERISPKKDLDRIAKLGANEASFLSVYMSNELNLFRETQESITIRDARHRVSEFPKRNVEQLKTNFTLALNQIKDFCGFKELIGFQSQPESDDNILRYFAATGEVSEEIKRVHYNWRKGSINHGERSIVFSSTNPDHIKNGLKKLPGNFYKDFRAFSAYSMASGPKALVIAKGESVNSVNLELFKDFFDRLGRNILHTVVSDVQAIALRETVELYRQQMLTGSHHMMDALSNSMFTLGWIIAKYKEEDTTPEIWDRIETIQSNMVSALGLTRRSLSWHRFTDKKYSISRSSLATLIKDCVSAKAAYADHRKVVIDVDPKISQLPSIDMDRDMMQMAVNCVMDNAVKYAHPSTVVTIDSYRKGKNIVLVFDDFGLGISDKDSETILDFQYTAAVRGKSEDEPKQGIGLHFAADVIYSHDGDIWFEQTSGNRTDRSRMLQGYRVKFFIKLPIRQET